MAQQKTRTFLLGRFEAGDRPTDQDFANLFESILFLNNDLSGHNNGIATDNTSIEGNFQIGGTLDLTGNFKMGAKLSVGNTAESLQSPISAYNTDNFAVYYASGSLSDIMFEGVSQDVTSSIKLTETLVGSTLAVPSTNTLIFGTSAGRAFLQNGGQEILHMTSSGYNGSDSPQVFISGSVGIGSKWENDYNNSHLLHIRDHNDVIIQLKSTKTDSRAQIRFANDVQEFVVGTNASDDFSVFDAISGYHPFGISTGVGSNTLYLSSNSRVGIGTNNPTSKLHINDTTSQIALFKSSNAGTNYIRVERSSETTIDLIAGADAYGGGLVGSKELRFMVNGDSILSPLMTLDTNNRVGIRTASPEATLHVVGDFEGLFPMMLIEGGEGINDQDVLILRDLGTTGAGNNANIKFQIAAAEVNIAEIQALSVGGSATSGGDLNLFTYSDDSLTANANQLYLKNDGKVGIGTDTPGETLDVQGVINSTTDFSATVGDDEGEYRLGSRTDFGVIGTNYSAQLQAPNSVYMMIDSNANDDSSKFKIQKHASTVGGGTTLFTVDQSGGVTGSAFVGNGSQLTGITGGQISGFVSTPGDNRLVTSNATGDGVFGEANLTFNGSVLTHILNTGNTSQDGIEISSQNSGLLSFTNNTSTPDEFLPIIKGKASSGLTAAGIAGLVLEGQTATDHVDNPSVIIRSRDAAGASASEDSPVLQINNWTTELITVDKDGKMGIGTTTPTTNLDIVAPDSEEAVLTLRGTTQGTGRLYVGQSSTHGGGLLYDGDGSPSFAGSAGVDRISFYRTTAGVHHSVFSYVHTSSDVKFETSVGIGKSPAVKLDVDGIIHAVDLIQIEGVDTNTAPGADYGKMSGYGFMGNRAAIYITNTDNTGVIRFGIGGVHATNNKMSIVSSGNVGIGIDAPTAQLQVGSTRPIKIGAGATPGSPSIEGSISSQGQSGGWANFFRFIGSSNTDHGGFYGHGSGDTFTKWGIAPAYDNEAGLHVVSAGNGATTVAVGIGTTTPSTNLHIKSQLDAAIWLEADTNDDAGGELDNAFLKISHDNSSTLGYFGTVGEAGKNPEGDAATSTLNNSLYLGSNTSTPLQLVTNNAARLTVLSGGSVGIGITDPETQLSVLTGFSIVNSDFKSAATAAGSRLIMGLGATSGDTFSWIQAQDLGATSNNNLILQRYGGRVGIGTISAGGSGTDITSAALHIHKSGTVNGTAVEILRLSRYTSDDLLSSTPVGEAYIAMHVGDASTGEGSEREVARISWASDNTNNYEGDGRIGFHTAKSTGGSAAGYALTEQMTITREGYVGIGTTLPDCSLEVESAADDLIARFNSSTSEDIVKGIRINAADAGGVQTYLDLVVDPLGNKIGLGIGAGGGTLPIGDANLDNAELVIDSSGNVGIGTSSPSEKLQVNGNINVVAGAISMDEDHKIEWSTATNDYAFITARKTASNAGYLELGTRDDGTEPIIFTQNAAGTTTERMRISANVGIGLPDAAHKFSVLSTNPTIAHFESDYSGWNGISVERTGGDKVNLVAGYAGIGGGLYSSDMLRFSTNASDLTTPQMIIETNGKVLIGLEQDPYVVPDELLTVRGVSPRIHITNTDETDGGIKFSDFDAITTQHFELLYDSNGSSGGNLRFRSDNTNNILTMHPLGNVGIGTATTSAKLHVAGSTKINGTTLMTESTTGNGYPVVHITNESVDDALIKVCATFKIMQVDATADFDTTERFAQFVDGAGTIIGYIHGEVSYGTFTGTHISQRPSNSTYSSWRRGMIVKSTGNIVSQGTTSISRAWPEVELTTTQKDKAVMGVFTTKLEPGHNFKGLDDSLPALEYNALGEGKLLVTDTNGDIETGDYICSSTITGLGEKQDDDILHNYTVAKATQPINFSNVSTDPQTGYKSVLVSCTYHCG